MLSENREAKGEGKRWGSSWSVEQSEHTQHLWIKFSDLTGARFVPPQNNYNSNIIKDHLLPQITVTNIMIMKMFEIL